MFSPYSIGGSEGPVGVGYGAVKMCRPLLSDIFRPGEPSGAVPSTVRILPLLSLMARRNTPSDKRCNQENLNEQLRNGVRAMRMPVDDLVSNWAYMLMAP